MEIENIHTRDGEEFVPNQISILVGPNNVGKTQTLVDIHKHLTNDEPILKMISDIDIDMPPTYEEFVRDLHTEQHPEQGNQRTVQEIGSNLQDVGGNVFREDSVQNSYESGNYGFVFNRIGEYFIAFLDASSRLEIAKSGPPHNAHDEQPETLLQTLYESDAEIEKSLQSAFRETFGMEIRFDYTGLGELSFRIGDNFDEISDDPREGRETMENYEKLDTQGHGFRSFVGVVLGLLLVPERIILLDEPAAFLHPPQARRLGDWIARNSDSFGQVLIATHNSNFISGILQQQIDVGIFRLNRPQNESTYIRQISADTTRDLSQDPLLSTQRVIESIFHRGVVVTEGGSDRSVYQSVATAEIDGHLPEETLFVDALGVGSIKKITGSLSGTSVPAAAIADLDILNDNGKLRYLLESMNESTEYSDIQDMMNKRGQIGNRVREEGTWESVKEHGIAAVPDDVVDPTQEVIEESKEHGLFIVPAGELEGWMDLGVDKSDWPIEALEAISDGNCDSVLVAFIDEVLEYLDNQYEIAADVE